MVLLISMVPAFLLAWMKNSPLRKAPNLCYVGAVGIDLGIVLAVWSGYLTNRTGIAAALEGVLTQGGLSGALFILVMYAGAVSNRSPYRKRILPIRGELSVLAATLAAGHNLAYGKKYFTLLFTSAAELKTNVLLAAICSLLMIMIMLPLWITSFPGIRRKMRPKNWKKLQRTAYGFYALMPIHILLLNSSGVKEGKLPAIVNVTLYSLVFLTYAIMRLRKAFLGKRKAAAAEFVMFTGIAVFCIVAALSLLPYFQHTEIRQQTVYEGNYADGKYTGAAIGYNGRLKVAVYVEEGKITELRLTSSVEDEPYQTRAKDAVFQAYLSNDHVQPDALTGATSTSEALIEAIGQAIGKSIEQASETDG